MAHANDASTPNESRRHDIHNSTRKYLVIILPLGKFRYIKMPMGLKISADVFQREMSKLFQNLDYVLVYIDDLLVVTKSSFQDHLSKLRNVLLKLSEKGM